MQDTYILGIESSCDENAAAVVRPGEQISNVRFSQLATHQPWRSRVGIQADLAKQLMDGLRKAGLESADLHGTAPA